MTDLTPREEGILAGLSSKWWANPYPEGIRVVNRDHEEYNKGFLIGQRLLHLTEGENSLIQES